MRDWEYERDVRLHDRYWYNAGVRSMAGALIDLVVPGRVSSALDIGCGPGTHFPLLAERAERVTGVDIAALPLQFVRASDASVGLVRGDATVLPFADESFELVNAIGVVEHLDDDVAFLSELHRVLAPKGVALLLTSAFPWLWSEHDVANEHRRRYTFAGFERLTAAAGLETLRLTHLNFLLFPLLATGMLAHRACFGLEAKHPRRFMPRVPRVVNGLLSWTLRQETRLATRRSLPWGTSLIGVFQRA
jgi:SAM-dependent methyltransferase